MDEAGRIEEEEEHRGNEKERRGGSTRWHVTSTGGNSKPDGCGIGTLSVVKFMELLCH